MARRGRKRRPGIEDEYWQLIKAGVGTVEACTRVGIGRKTGYRWRAERGGSGRYLSLLERQRIATQRRQGLTIRQIAQQLTRSPSTISRELRRNTSPHDVGGYDGDIAHSRARERAERPGGGRLLTDPGLRHAVQDKLASEWSPRADRRMAARRVPQPATLARVPRNDLPGPLQPRARRAEQEIDNQAAHRPAPA